MPGTPNYAAFIGTWQLIPQSCRYEQGAAPASVTQLVRLPDGERPSNVSVYRRVTPI